MLLPSSPPDGDPLWEALLEPAEQPAERGAVDAPRIETAREMPVVRIEAPGAWLIENLGVAADVREQLAADAAHRYLVVRFDCSFRPRGDKVRVEWARFRAQLSSDATDGRPIAEDLHPVRVERTAKRNVVLKISPSIKFAEAELGLGELSRASDYEVVEPVIDAAGRGGDDLSWDYSGGPEGSVSGGKRMHALVKLPASATFLDAGLEISADLLVDRRLLWAAKRADDPNPISVRVWP